MTQVADIKERYVADFRRLAPAGLADLRKRAIARFEALGFPTGREEAWRFTDTTPVEETSFRPAAGTANPHQVADVARGPLKACQIAFVDGRFAPAFTSLDLPKGVRVESLGALLRQGTELPVGRAASFEMNPFAALNSAFFSDGAAVFLSKGAAAGKPIHLLFLSTFHGEPYVSHPRVLVVAEESARATIVESWLGPAGGTYWTNAVTEVFAGPGSAIDYYKVQRESLAALHFATLQCRQERDSRFTHHSISLGGRLARNDLATSLEGEGAEAVLNGLYEVAGAQLVDHHTTIDHAKPHGTSRELYKGVLNGKARAVFDGKIVVRPAAQKTNAMQTNKNLLLSTDALVNTKPQLEIFANDVKCKHGATIGQLDRDVLFYLRSRGIPYEDARRLLIHAFASEIIDEVKVEAIRAQVGGCLLLLMSGA